MATKAAAGWLIMELEKREHGQVALLACDEGIREGSDPETNSFR